MHVTSLNIQYSYSNQTMHRCMKTTKTFDFHLWINKIHMLKEHIHPHIPCAYTLYSTHTHSLHHHLQCNPDDEAVLQHLPAVMAEIMRIWHLLDIKNHSSLSGLAPFLFTFLCIWCCMMEPMETLVSKGLFLSNACHTEAIREFFNTESQNGNTGLKTYGTTVYSSTSCYLHYTILPVLVLCGLLHGMVNFLRVTLGLVCMSCLNLHNKSPKTN